MALACESIPLLPVRMLIIFFLSQQAIGYVYMDSADFCSVLADGHDSILRI